MTIYIIIFLLFYSASIFEVGGLKKKQASWTFIGLATVFVLFVGLRYNTGADWAMYIQVFDGEPANMEYGYLLLNKIFKAIFDNYYVMQFSCTLFFVFAVSRFYKKESPYPIATLAILICFMLFNDLMAQIRQSIAIAIIMLFSNFIFERKFFRFLLGILIASFFHSSAVAAIPLYFLYRNYSKILLISLILVANVFYFYPDLLRIIVIQIIPLLPDIISEKAAYYMKTIFAEKAEFNTGLYYLIQLAVILFSVLFVKTEDKKKAFFVNSLVMFAIIKSFSISIFILSRLESYYLIYGLIAFTYIWDVKIRGVQQSTSRLLLVVIFLLFFFISPVRLLLNTKESKLTGRAGNYGVVPYYNCISHPEEAKLRKDWDER